MSDEEHPESLKARLDYIHELAKQGLDRWWDREHLAQRMRVIAEEAQLEPVRPACERSGN